MTLLLPDVSTTLEKLMSIRTSHDSRTQTIEEWVKEHREDIKTNLRLTQERSDENDMKVLRIFLRELTQCRLCPINGVCLTGKQRNTNALA